MPSGRLGQQHGGEDYSAGHPVDGEDRRVFFCPECHVQKEKWRFQMHLLSRFDVSENCGVLATVSPTVLPQEVNRNVVACALGRSP